MVTTDNVTFRLWHLFCLHYRETSGFFQNPKPNINYQYLAKTQRYEPGHNLNPRCSSQPKPVFFYPNPSLSISIIHGLLYYFWKSCLQSPDFQFLFLTFGKIYLDLTIISWRHQLPSSLLYIVVSTVHNAYLVLMKYSQLKNIFILQMWYTRTNYDFFNTKTKKKMNQIDHQNVPRIARH